jgi:HPt (histidine-containing phosphotransfer) domain-containing protein
MDELPVLDGDSLNELASVGPEFVAEMLNLLIETGLAQVRDMVSALHNGDILALTRLAHSLKGAAAGVGARELAHASAALEHADRNERGNLPTLVNEVSVCFERVRAAVADLYAGGV